MAANNIIRFTLTLGDLASKGMGQFKAFSSKVASSFASDARRMSGAMRGPASSIDMMNRKLDELRKTRNVSVDYKQITAANREIQKLEREVNKLENTGLRNSGGRARGMLGGLGIGSLAARIAPYALAASGVMLLGKAAGIGMEGGAQKTSFQVLAGEQAGAKLYKDLTKFAQESIFGNEVYKNAQTMLAFGQKSQDIMPRTKMLGDISMGNKERLSALTLAYSQNQAAGRLMGQDLLQFINAGWNPLQEISQMTGKKLKDLKNAMQQGAISSDMVTAALEHATGPMGKFYQMTEKIAKTPFGQWEAFKGQLQGNMRQLGTNMLPLLGRVIPLLSQASDKLPRLIDELKPVFEQVGNAAEEIWPKVQQFGGNLWNAAKPLITLVTSKESTALLGSLLDLATEITGAVTPALKDLASNIKIASGGLGKVFGKFTDTGGGKAVGHLLNLLSGNFLLNGDLDRSGQHKINKLGNISYEDWLRQSGINKAVSSADSSRLFGAYLNASVGRHGKLFFKNESALTDIDKAVAGKNILYLDMPGAQAAPGGVKGGTGMKPADMSSLGGAGAAITGGGSRPINIYLQKEMVKVDNIHIQGGTREAVDDLKRIARQAFLEVLESAKANG